MLLKEVTPVLMCGGDGTRLRPLSRRSCPKPFIKYFKKRTLFQKTLARMSDFGVPLILTREDLEPLVVEQVGVCDMVLEPIAKNTAPAIIKACLEAEDRNKPYLFVPTDHDIRDVTPLVEAIESLRDWEERITLFGVCPDRPEIRYGYIGAGDSVTFHEKPCAQKAQSYIEKGYLWNSGMVFATPNVILREAQLHAPELLQLVESNRYEEIKPISFDYAILEKSETIRCVPVDLIWRDVGTFRSYFNYIWKPYDRFNRQPSCKAKYKPYSDDRAKSVLSES